MIGMKPASQVQDERQKRLEERTSEFALEGEVQLHDEMTMSPFAAMIRKDWHRNRDNKTRVERDLLDSLRARKGEYAPEKLSQIRETGGSTTWVNATATKVRTAEAQIKSIILPAGRFSHGLAPTRNPSLPEWMVDKAVAYLQENPYFQDENGNTVSAEDRADQFEHMLRVNLYEDSKKAARKMEAYMQDQLEQGNFKRAVSDAIGDLCTYKACFMRGPYYVNKPTTKWEMNDQGVYAPIRKMGPVMMWRSFDPFDAYGQPGSDSVQKGTFIERLRLSQEELYAMREIPEVYDVEAIDRVLDQTTYKQLDSWLWTDSERKHIADHNYFWYESTTEIDGLHWHGKVQGKHLIEHGVPASMIDNPLRPYEVDAILIGREIIKVTMNTDFEHRRNVNSACYERIAGNIFGNSIYDLMKDDQEMINAAGRALQNNLAHSSGFQAVVDYTRLADETDATDIFPFKVWQGRESEHSGNRPIVEFFQPDSNVDTLISVMREYTNMIDMHTGIPSFLHGGDAGTDTARSHSLLRSDQAKLLRLAISNFDEDMITPNLRYVYDKNMEDPDCPEENKGDAQIVPKGILASLQAEGAAQEQMAVLDLLGNDYDRQLLGDERRFKLMRNLLDTMDSVDTDEIIPTDEEIAYKLQQRAATPPPPDPNMLKIEMQAENDRARLEFEREKLSTDYELEKEKIAVDIQRDAMDREVKIKVSEDDLDKKRQEEVIKLRAARQSAHEQGIQDMKLEQMKLVAQARIEKAKLDAATKAMPANEQPTSEESYNQLKEMVISSLDDFRNTTMDMIRDAVTQVSSEPSETSALELHVHTGSDDKCVPVSKKVNVRRNPETHELEGTITSHTEGES